MMENDSVSDLAFDIVSNIFSQIKEIIPPSEEFLYEKPDENTLFQDAERLLSQGKTKAQVLNILFTRATSKKLNIETSESSSTFQNDPGINDTAKDDLNNCSKQVKSAPNAQLNALEPSLNDTYNVPSCSKANGTSQASLFMQPSTSGDSNDLPKKLSVPITEEVHSTDNECSARSNSQNDSENRKSDLQMNYDRSTDVSESESDDIFSGEKLDKVFSNVKDKVKNFHLVNFKKSDDCDERMCATSSDSDDDNLSENFKQERATGKLFSSSVYSSNDTSHKNNLDGNVSNKPSINDCRKQTINGFKTNSSTASCSSSKWFDEILIESDDESSSIELLDARPSSATSSSSDDVQVVHNKPPVNDTVCEKPNSKTDEVLPGPSNIANDANSSSSSNANIEQNIFKNESADNMNGAPLNSTHSSGNIFSSTSSNTFYKNSNKKTEISLPSTSGERSKVNAKTGEDSAQNNGKALFVEEVAKFLPFLSRQDIEQAYSEVEHCANNKYLALSTLIADAEAEHPISAEAYKTLRSWKPLRKRSLQSPVEFDVNCKRVAALDKTSDSKPLVHYQQASGAAAIPLVASPPVQLQELPMQPAGIRITIDSRPSSTSIHYLQNYSPGSVESEPKHHLASPLLSPPRNNDSFRSAASDYEDEMDRSPFLAMRGREAWIQEKTALVASIIENMPLEIISQRVRYCYNQEDIERVIDNLLNDAITNPDSMHADPATADEPQPGPSGYQNANNRSNDANRQSEPSTSAAVADSEGADGDTNNGNDDEEEDWLDTHVRTLCDMFTDGDPDYLATKCKEVNGNQVEFEALVLHLMENKEYPKMDEYLRRKKKEEIRSKFLGEMTATEFLELIEDPEKVFCDTSKNMSEEYKANAKHQLCIDLPSVLSLEIDKYLVKNNYHYLPTLRELKAAGSKVKRRKTKRCQKPFTGLMDDFLLKEKCYVGLEKKIKAHFKEKELRKEKAFKLAKEAGLLMECPICCEEEVLEEDMRPCNADVPHNFCRNCVKNHAEELIGQGRLDFRCMEGSCKEEFPLGVLKSVLKSSVFSNILKRKQTQEIVAAGIDDLESCPFCDFATIMPNKDDKVFMCQNPECMKDSCRLCKEPNHIPLRCEEVESRDQQDARTYLENQMSEAMVRKCYSCGKRFIKGDGCNKMTCSCGAVMCYLCKKPIKGYDHFTDQPPHQMNPFNNLNMPGTSKQTAKCPLWSNSLQIHAEEVQKRAEEAKKAIDPKVELKHDPTKDIPQVPDFIRMNNRPNVPVMHGLAARLMPHRARRLANIRNRYNDINNYDMNGAVPRMRDDGPPPAPPGLFIPFGPPVAPRNFPVIMNPFGPDLRAAPAAHNNIDVAALPADNGPPLYQFPLPPPAAHQALPARQERNWFHVHVNLENNNPNNQRVAVQAAGNNPFHVEYNLMGPDRRLQPLQRPMAEPRHAHAPIAVPMNRPDRPHNPAPEGDRVHRHLQDIMFGDLFGVFDVDDVFRGEQ